MKHRNVFMNPEVSMATMNYKAFIGVFTLCILVAGTGLTAIPSPGGSNDAYPARPAAASETLSFTFSPPEISSRDGYCSVAVPEASSSLQHGGAPMLPQHTETLHLPAGATITGISLRHGEVYSRQLTAHVLPALEPAAVGRQTAPQRVEGAVYDGSDAYPSGWVDWHTGVGLHDGERVTFCSLQVFPARYIPASRELRYVEDVTVEIQYRAPEKPVARADMYDLLIVAPQEYVETLQPLVDHKEQHGIATKLVAVDDIYSGSYFTVQGEDNPAHIKYFIRDAIEEWGIRYLMLVGDIETVPSRLVYSFWGGGTMYADYYYADIYGDNMTFCSWDSNGNGRYGETEEGSRDQVDLYADVYMGRLLCADVEEVETVVDKIVTYESSAGGSEWFNRLILMGGDTFPGWGVYEGELVNQYVADALPEFEHVKIQMVEGNFLPHRINQIWTEGAGLVCYSGHGFEYGFGTYPHDNRWMIAYYTPYLLRMQNQERLPVVFFDACLTAKLEYHMLGMEDVPCFAWALVKKPDGGAIATIGATETATTSVDEDGPHGQAGYLDLHFFQAYEPGRPVGEMLVHAKHDYLNDVAAGQANDRFYVMTIEQFQVMGDPSLNVGGY